MATLQDLFNELQADERILTPDTFEEFQSKMESPDYAAKVDDVLSRNGYDLNAYEGLKKKEESMVESAPLSQSESEQPSETTEPTQMGGIEPVGEVVSEDPQAETEEDLDPLNADLSAYNMEIKTPLSSIQNTPIQAAPQQQNVVDGSVMNESVDAPKPVNKYKNNDIISLAKNAKNKFISKHIDPIFSQAKQATAQFDQEIKPEEETLSQVEEGGPGDPKRKDVKGAATSLYNEMDDLNHKTASRVLGDTRVLGVKMDGDNYEVVFTNNKMGGGDQGRSYKGKVGDVTWEGYISNAINSSDLYKDEESWEDLKSAVITQDTYSPELEGKKLSPSFNNNLASHKSKYFPQGSFGQITGTVTIGKEKNKEEEASFGTDLKRFFEKVKVKVKTQNIINKDDEERKEYNIAEETIPKTDYVMDTEQTFYNSLNNTPETNAIMQENALSFSDILLPSSKNKETVMEGIKLFLAKAGYDENEINQKSGVIYKQMLRDARYHTAEQYIRHEIENGNKTYKFQDIDRLNQAKEKGTDELMGDESLVTQSDKNFVSNVWDISLSDYINHYDAKATVRGRNMDIKNIPGKVSAYTARMNELEAQIEAEKVKLQIPSKEQLSETVKGLKSTKDKIDAYDAQLSKMEEDMNSLLVDQDGQKYFKDEASKTIYEELVAQSEKILNERNALVEQNKAGSQDIEKVNQFQNNISRQLKEYEALRKKLNYYDDDPDLLAMRGLSNTLTSIQNYESDKSAGIKNDLYDFQDYREKVRQDDEIARKEAEDDNMLEAGGKGLVGGFANALIGISKTGMYLGQVLTDEDSDQKEWTGGDELLAATSQLQENVGQWASNPYYEKWGLNWFVNGVGGVVPDLAAVYFTGGGAGFAELATTRGAIGAVGKIATSPTTVYFTVRSTGDYAERLQKAGYSAGEAFLGGGLIAGTEAMLESLLPSFFNTTESISIKSFWKKTIEEGIAKKLAPEVIARQLKEGTIGIARNSGKLITTNTFNEKIEEGTQTLFTEVAFAGSTDETIQIFDPKTGGMGKTLEAVTEASAIGGATGLVGSSAKGIRTLIKEKANNTTLKLTQLQIGRKYTEIINEADRLSKDFKGSEVEKEYEKINKEYKKLSANPNFLEYDDLAQSEVLDKSLALNDLKEAQKNYESQNIVDVKLNNQIAEKEKELVSIINTAQENTDVRNDMNKQLEEIGVKSFTLNANGEVNGITFDEWTTSEEEKESTEKAIEIIEKVYKPKAQENAVQEPSTTEVLPRQQGETTETGSQREGMGSSVQGQGTTQEVGKEEIVATPKEAKEPEAMQNDIDQVQQSTGTVINLNEDGTITINAPQRGGQSKKDAAIENAKQELANLGYNVESRVAQPTQQEVAQEEGQREFTDEEFGNTIKETEGMGVVAGTQSMNDLQKRTAQDPKKGKIVAQASRAVNALKSLFPNMNIVVHESDESYNKAMNTLGGTVNTRGQFVYKPSADGNIQGAVHINLNRANSRTIAHEVAHAALLKMFKGDGKVFGNFKDKLKDIAKDQKMTITDKDGNEVETTWGDEAEKLSSRYQTEDQAEEYLAELAGLVAELDLDKPVNKSILQKIADFINNFILSNPQLKALGVKPISDTSSAEEVLEFFDTLGKKISRGEEIKTEYVNQSGEKLTNNDITYKLQNDFTDEKTGFSFEYLKNTEEFKKLEENGTITNDRELSDFNGDYVIAHQPDGAFSGDIYKTDPKTGEKYKVVDGKGGVFYPIKFNKQGYFWASTRDGAKKLTDLLNDVYNKNGGKILMALTSAPKDKLLSSTLAANAVIDIFKSKQLDENLKLSQADVKNALVKGAKSVIVKTDNNGKQKQVGLNLKTVNQKMTFEEIENLVREQLSPDNSSFGDRKVFVESFVSSLVDNIKTKRSEQELGEFFSKSIGNKGFKGEYASGYKLSKANVLQSISDMMLEPMFKTDDRNGSVYAMLETDSEVELVETDEHPSYPFAIKAKNNDVKVHILQDRLLWDENVLNSETGKPMTKEESLKVMPTTAGITFKPVIINSKGGVVAKAQMDDVQRTAQMYNMNDQGFFPKNADEYKINKDFERFGLKAKRANASSWGPGSLYLVNQAGRKVNPFNRPKGKSQLSEEELNIAEQVAGNAKSIMDTTGVSQAEAIKQAVLEVTEGDQDAADRYLKQSGIKELLNNKIKQIKAKTERELEAESPEVTISERKLLLDRVKAEVKAALEGRKEGKKEGVEQGKEQAQKTIDALNKKLEEGKITKQELQDRIKELGYNIRFEAGVARLAGERTGKSLGKKFGEFVGYFKGLKAGRTEQRGLGALVSEYIKDVVDNEFGKKGSISPATLKSISRRAATISNQKQLDAFVSYLDKIIANRRLAEGINEIQRQQKKLLNKLGYQYTSQMKQFAKFDLYTADGDLAFDMNTLEQYLQALEDLNQKVPNIGKMMQLFDDMYDINQQNMPADIDIVEEFKKWQDSSKELFTNTSIGSFEDYRKFKREVGKYMRALNTLLDTGVINESQYEAAKNKVIEDSAPYDAYSTQFQDQIDALKQELVQGITDNSNYSLVDSIKDWLKNSPNTFTENQRKLIDQLLRAKADNLMELSLDDLDLLNQVVVQIAENGFVDEKNLRTLLDRAEIRGNEIGKSLAEQAKQTKGLFRKDRYSNAKNGYINMMNDTLGKSVVFWESRLGMKENGPFRKHLVDPIVRAINGWEKDSQRILKDYQKKVEKLRSINIFKNPSDIKKLINKTKIEKFKLTSDGNLVPDGTIKVSKDAYDRVMIGVVGHILDNAWNAKQKKKTVSDWLGKQMLSAKVRNNMANEDVNELDIVNNIYNDLKESFPDGNGGLDHMAVLEAFESDPTSVLTGSQLEYYNIARSTLQEAGEYINSANAIRNKQHELNPYYMPRQSVGVREGTLTSTDIAYNKNVGEAIRSGASYQRVLQVPTEAIRYNVDRLVMTNVHEGLRDYYLTEAKRYVRDVFSNAKENASQNDAVMLDNLKQLSDTIAPFALAKSENTFGLSKMMGKFFVDALIGFVRTPIEFTTNLISYAVGNRSLKSLTLPFTPKEKQETDKLLSEFDSSVQFTGLERKVKLSGKKGIDGYLDRESRFSLINKFLNNVTGFMRKGEWKSQFEREFERNTGEKFSYEKHFVKEKGKYYDEMSKAASDADFRMRRIMKGGNKAEQRQFIEWFPFVKSARISADSKMAPFVGMFSGFINHDADNLNIGLRKAVTQKEIKDGLTQALGAYGRLSLYPVLMVIGKAIANLNLGDDDEKKEAQETLDSLKTPKGWSDMALFAAKQVGATFFGGKYAAGGKIIGNLLLDAAYTLSDDRRQRRLIEDTMRDLYFVDPIDFYDLPSEKDDMALQIAANLQPIVGMVIDGVSDFANDVKNKGREQVTLYDIYEWTQQTEEGKQWMYMANSLATLGQTLTVVFTPGAVPFIDDYVRWAEDELSQKEPNENTLYKTPGGEVVDIRELFLDDSQRLPINTPGISSRERDKYSILATEKFNKAIKKEEKQIKGLFPDEKYLYIDYLADKAKYEAGSELGFPTERWSEAEGEMVSGEPIPPSERDNTPESEVTLEKLHQEIMKGKQLSFVQNIKEKRKVEDYMFKEFDKAPNMENDYKNATIGGKLGVREYFKAKYLYDKYKLTEPPVSSNYFIKEKGQIKQVESTPTEEN